VRGLTLHLISDMLPLARYYTHQRSIGFTGMNCYSARNFSEIIGAIKEALPPGLSSNSFGQSLKMRLSGASNSSRYVDL